MIYNDSKYNSKWDTKALSDLGEFKRGKSKHRPRNDPNLFKEGKYPLIQTGEIREANLYITHHTDMYNDFGLKQSKLWKENTLCITIAANIAETALLGYPMCFPDSIVGFNAYPNESSELFMHYVFTYIKKAIQNSASGSIQDNINIEYLAGLKFKIPGKSYQDKICSVLSALDLKYELNNQIITELENTIKTLYDYWFIQYDYPDVTGKPYKTSGGELVYINELKTKIPKGWKVKNLSEIESNIITGKTPSTEDPNNYNGDVPFITIGDIRGNMHIVKTQIKLSQKGADSQKSKYIPKGALCVTCIASPGLIGYATQDSQTNQQINSIIINNIENKTFLYFALNNYFKYSKGAKTGNTFANMSKGDFESIKIIYPPRELLLKFEKFSEAFINQILNLSFQNQNVLEVRDWLLPLLMNGQVKIKNN